MWIHALGAFALSVWLSTSAAAQSPLFDPEALYTMGGRALAGAIQMARDEAMRAGTQPIPQAVRGRLAGAFPPELLERVTWRVSPHGSLAMQAFRYGDVQAMTLIDVVVFQKEEDALGNDALWAHELVHVRQYERWGVEEFAQRYARDHKGIEDEAYGFQAEYEARAR